MKRKLFVFAATGAGATAGGAVYDAYPHRLADEDRDRQDRRARPRRRQPVRRVVSDPAFAAWKKTLLIPPLSGAGKSVRHARHFMRRDARAACPSLPVRGRVARSCVPGARRRAIDQRQHALEIAQMNSRPHLLWRHLHAKAARDFVWQAPYPLRFVPSPLRERDSTCWSARAQSTHFVRLQPIKTSVSRI